MSNQKSKQKNSIELTREQFLALLKAVYLGNWVANAHREVGLLKEYENIEDCVFSYAKQFGYGKYVDDELADEGRYFPTRNFEEETDVNLRHDEYDDEIFWDELIERMAERDVISSHSRKELMEMGRLEFADLVWQAEAKYEGIFEKRGLDAIEVKGNN